MPRLALSIALLIIIPILAFSSKALTSFGDNAEPVQTPNYVLSLTQNIPNGKNIISTSKKQGNAPLKVNFEAKVNAFQVNNNDYNWNFGDGEATQGKNVTHTFAIPGEYSATLSVENYNNSITQQTITITVIGETENPIKPEKNRKG